ncbi:MAG TPA: winged helix-turn-helix domain-containing protein [Phycisphaerae bacterium]|nr:winged helix-turn-helix domain-containing protein [Phycisphaerae bacterium]
MKKADVKVGGVYSAKVSGKVVPVRIDGESPHGGWNATNTATGKKVRIKSAQRLRGVVHKSKPLALAIPSQAGGGKTAADAKAAKRTKVETWRKEVATKVATPDAAVDAAVRANADARRAAKEKKPTKGDAKKAGCLDAAVEVLKAAGGGPLGCKEMVERMLAKGLWQTKGKTPEATLYAAIIREIANLARGSRFRKEGRGQFALAGGKDAGKPAA